jgi:hypothetical protein
MRIDTCAPDDVCALHCLQVQEEGAGWDDFEREEAWKDMAAQVPYATALCRNVPTINH